ncbi:MAG TPA: hypothetical protein VMX16_08040 [Terriglobia bacterium]|nr:hypothetical protein [Terriglobia bacterium]
MARETANESKTSSKCHPISTKKSDNNFGFCRYVILPIVERELEEGIGAMAKKKNELVKLLDWVADGNWWDWARRHPQTLAAAALLLAATVALVPHSKKTGHATSEPEETPLFI